MFHVKTKTPHDGILTTVENSGRDTKTSLRILRRGWRLGSIFSWMKHFREGCARSGRFSVDNKLWIEPGWMGVLIKRLWFYGLDHTLGINESSDSEARCR